MIFPVVNSTGNIQPSYPWAFYEYPQTAEPRGMSNYGLMLTSLLFPSNTAQLSYRPENIIRGPLSIAGIAGFGDISAFSDSPLNWDVGVEVAPPRPSGKISVTIHYAGRGVPRPIDDY